MGQYYAVVNVDSEETLSQHMFGSGLKLMESCYVGNAFVDALSYLLDTDWRGARVFLCGDYAYDDMYSPSYGHRYTVFSQFHVADDPYELARGYRDRSTDFSTCMRENYEGRPIEGTFAVDPGHRRFVVNETEGVYYDREECPVAWMWRDESETPRFTRTDPLTIFLAVGNGGGGGDYHGSNSELAGAWAGHLITFADVEPSGYRKIASPFDESGLFLTASDEALRRAVGAFFDQAGADRDRLPSLPEIKSILTRGFEASVRGNASFAASTVARRPTDGRDRGKIRL